MTNHMRVLCACMHTQVQECTSVQGCAHIYVHVCVHSLPSAEFALAAQPPLVLCLPLAQAPSLPPFTVPSIPYGVLIHPSCLLSPHPCSQAWPHVPGTGCCRDRHRVAVCLCSWVHPLSSIAIHPELRASALLPMDSPQGLRYIQMCWGGAPYPHHVFYSTPSWPDCKWAA